jgi:hypothetical protein
LFFRELQSKPHQLWLDNFTKLYNTSLPGLKGGARNDCLWTGAALVQVDGLPSLSMRLHRMPDGSVMSAMHPRICTSYFINNMKAIVAAVDVSGIFHLDSSICSRYNVNNVPCKPIPDMIREPGLHALLSQSPDGLQNWFPKSLLKRNIGSNVGLMKILRDFVIDIEVKEPPVYGMILADINIFWRTLKVTHAYVAHFIVSCTSLDDCLCPCTRSLMYYTICTLVLIMYHRLCTT